MSGTTEEANTPACCDIYIYIAAISHRLYNESFILNYSVGTGTKIECFT
jgi:hypothetical protein